MKTDLESVTVLALETSCDETGIAVLRKSGSNITVLGQSLSSQIDVHKMTGGVVPEVAAREHMSIINPMIKEVLTSSSLTLKDIDAIAVTVGPGLIPALSVGVGAAKALAYAWQKPLIPVNHMEGHIYSAFLNRISDNEYTIPDIFPALALIVSGGHTLLVKVSDHMRYEIVGTTRDDAAGEAFDKVARLLSLPYPGGPHLSKIAATGNPSAFAFPRPMLDSGDFDFSFSGLKTAVLYAIREIKEDQIESRKADIAASFEQALVESLVVKTKQAAQSIMPKALLLAGGVAANTRLREQLDTAAKELDVELKIAPLALCGDNAVMIGQVGVLAYEKGRQTTWSEIDAIARPALTSFTDQAYAQAWD